MIVFQGDQEDTYPYGPKSHVWEYTIKRHPDGTPVERPDGSYITIKMDGIISEAEFKKKYGFLAKFECMECKYRWETKPGPLNCFKCGYIWVRWLNYKKCAKVMYR